MPEDQVAAPRRDPAVDDGDQPPLLRQCVEPERILIEEGDVDDVLPGLQHTLDRRVPHMPGDRPDHQVRIGDDPVDLLTVPQIGPRRAHIRDTLHPRERIR